MKATGGRELQAFRIVQGATLAALLWKVQGYVDVARLYLEMPLRQTFFPDWLQSPPVLIASYLTATVALAAALVIGHRIVLCGVSVLAWLGLTILCLHQGSYNDATFTTAWWASLWSVWLASRLGTADERLPRRAARLAQAILSLMFLGGAVGKWTAEYWSGQVFYEIYFIDRDFWFFNRLRASASPEALRELATWYSRTVIIVETLCGMTLWGLRPRVAGSLAAVVCAGVALFASFYLFSVMLSLIGLAVACLWLTPNHGQADNKLAPSPQ